MNVNAGHRQLFVSRLITARAAAHWAQSAKKTISDNATGILNTGRPESGQVADRNAAWRRLSSPDPSASQLLCQLLCPLVKLPIRHPLCPINSRFLLLLASPLVGIFCNVLRTLPTIWLYGRYGSEGTLAKSFHTYSGWAMYLVSFLLLLTIIKALKCAMLPITRFPLASQYA